MPKITKRVTLLQTNKATIKMPKISTRATLAKEYEAIEVSTVTRFMTS